MRLIDAGMLAFAGYHALKGKVEWPLTFQVPRMLRSTIRDEGPDTYALFWNAERLRKRELWPDYRNRPEIWHEADEEDFRAMLEVLSALGAVQFRADGWEADEALAALVHELRAGSGGDEDILIHSDDKDFMQLLSGSTWMKGRRRGEVRHSDVKGILGVSPVYVADFLALAGDEADGIPGPIPPSVARELIRTRGHVREWLDRDLRIREEVREAIRAERDQIRLNLRLVDLSEEALGRPPPPGPEEGADGIHRADWDRAREIGERTGIEWLQDPDLSREYGMLREWGDRTRDRLEEVSFRS